ncbi:MAG: hypothetical protein II047_04165, partial [Bacteroidales bacterium]|nr:hypothetical protein [Bacteroidales bacterium]
VRNPEMEVSLMFDWANMALSTIRDNAQIHVAWYEESMRDKVLWDQKIVAQLDKAIEVLLKKLEDYKPLPGVPAPRDWSWKDFTDNK